MKRLFDFIVATVLILFLALPMLILACIVRVTSKGPVLYWSNRIGRVGVIFQMPKFRTMHFDAPTLATHLMTNPNSYLSPVGDFLRRTSLDEMPQLFSILIGDMSFVGPRPALFNQDDLIKQRKNQGIDILIPGVTGWAQVNGRDRLSILDKVALDSEYLERQSFWFDMKILWITLFKVIKRDNVSH